MSECGSKDSVIWMNWLRVFDDAEASHMAYGVCQPLYPIEGRQINAVHPVSQRGTGRGVVAACFACARIV